MIDWGLLVLTGLPYLLPVVTLLWMPYFVLDWWWFEVRRA